MGKEPFINEDDLLDEFSLQDKDEGIRSFPEKGCHVTGKIAFKCEK